jgi:CRP-like cAMP-binding protein
MSLCKGCPAFPHSIFCLLTDSQIDDIREGSITILYKKGQDIILRGGENQGLFCIRSGIVKLYLNSPRGDNVTVAIKTLGGLLGHLELLREQTLFSVACLTDVSLCFFPRKQILSSLERVFVFNKRIVLELNIDIENIVNHLKALSFYSIHQRTAQAILYLKEKTGTDKDGVIKLRLSRQEFSNIVGASREAVSREVAYLKKIRCIEVEGQSLRVVDEDKLKSLSGK